MLNLKSTSTRRWIGILLSVALVGCGIHKDGHVGKVKILSQREVIKEWVKGSEQSITFVPEKLPFHYDADAISPDFLLVPKGRDIPLDVVKDQLLCYAGAPYQALWLYTLPELEEKCYVNSAVSPVFPVSSRGLCVLIEHISARSVAAEDIYVVEDSVVYHYSPEEFSSIGWENVETNTFRFNIPANRTGKERYWMVKMYNTEKKDDDEQNRIYNLLNSEDVTGRHPLKANLCFMQVTDTVSSERLSREKIWRYRKYVPNIEKYWSVSFTFIS